MRVEPAVWLRAALAAALLATALASAFDLTVRSASSTGRWHESKEGWARMRSRCPSSSRGANSAGTRARRAAIRGRERRARRRRGDPARPHGAPRAALAGAFVSGGVDSRRHSRLCPASAAARGRGRCVTARTAGDLRPGGCNRGGGPYGCRAGLATSGGPSVRARVLASSATRRGGTHLAIALPADRLAAPVQPALLGISGSRRSQAKRCCGRASRPAERSLVVQASAGRMTLSWVAAACEAAVDPGGRRGRTRAGGSWRRTARPSPGRDATTPPPPGRRQKGRRG